ncbi:MAG: LPS export ABC transporter permease LptF [Trichloromonas sp.]|jgi:lipopolysaccharide export system permease protein|nr:LPS export ABC transporter permease LptF [Trichloromonas sp.]
MSTGRIHRYIAREVGVPTLLALVVFTFVLLMGRILKLMELVINKGVPAIEILQLFSFLIPTFLVITLPLAFLLGVMLGLGRLSSDNEIIALKASGVSLYYLFRPVLALALITALLTGILTLILGPAGNRAFREQIFNIAARRANVGIQPHVFNDEFDDLVLYVDEEDEVNHIFKGVMISDQRTGTTPSIIFAQQGRIFSDPEALTLTLRIENGAIHRATPGKEADQIIRFSTYDVNLNMGQQLEQAEKRPPKPAEIRSRELAKALFSDSGTSPENPKLAIEFHSRLIFPLAPLLFALVGVPLGVHAQRSGRSGNFSIALFVFLSYYLSLSLAETLVVESGFPAALSLWFPSLLFFIGGLVLFQRAAQERRLLPLWDQVLSLWKKNKGGGA